jgi:hypothetical protein
MDRARLSQGVPGVGGVGAWLESGWSQPLNIAVKISQGSSSHQSHGEAQLLDQQRETPCDRVCAAYGQSV